MSLEIEIRYLLIAFFVGIVIAGIIFYLFYQRNHSALHILKQKLEKKQLKIDKLYAKISQMQKQLDCGEGATQSTSFIHEQIIKIETLEQMLQKEREKVVKAKKIAQEASLVKEDFLANIRHEIRTPMNSILVFSNMLKNELEEIKHKNYAKSIVQSGQRLLSLLDEIIELSNLQSGILEIKENAVDVPLFFETIIQEEQRNAQKKSLKLELFIADDVPHSLIFDNHKVKEIVKNFIENGIKFTMQGSVSVAIKVDRFQIVNNTVDLYISVTDTGIGIEEKNFETIFEIFDKREKVIKEEFESTGLGLSINKKTAQLMGGDIKLQSKLSQGSTFTLVLKNVAIVLDSNHPEEIDENEIDFQLIKPEGANIMIIDDSQESRAIVLESFEGTNIKVYHYNNSRDAIETLKIKKMDLIFIELNLLIAEENAVSKVIAKISQSPVVTLTSKTPKDIYFVENGAKIVGHMKKPIIRVDLFKTSLTLLNAEYYNNKYNKKYSMQKQFFATLETEQAQKFFQVLKENVNNYYNLAQKTNDLTHAQLFAEALLKESKEFKMTLFIQFANELLGKITLFDIAALTDLMDQYKKLLQVLQSQI